MFTFLLIDWIFFSLLVIISGIIFIMQDNDHMLGWSHTLFIVIACLIAYKTKDSWSLKDIGFITILKYAGSYILIGIAWAFLKWYSYLKNIASLYSKLKDSVNKNMEDLKRNPDYNSIWASETKSNIIFTNRMYDAAQNSSDFYKLKRYMERINCEPVEIKNTQKTKYYKYKFNAPEASYKKSLIVSWITHWPLSLIWTLINDPIMKLMNYVFDLIKNMFESISKHVFKNALKDFGEQK